MTHIAVVCLIILAAAFAHGYNQRRIERNKDEDPR